MQVSRAWSCIIMVFCWTMRDSTDTFNRCFFSALNLYPTSKWQLQRDNLTPSLCTMGEICKRAPWVTFSKAVKPIWKVMKFRLLHCSWAHHPEMEPEFQTNAICIEKSTRAPVFQRRLESCSCHSDSYRQIFKEPKHPVCRGLLKDTDHLFYIPKWTSFENPVQQGGSEPVWGPMGDTPVMGARGRCCSHLQTLRLAEAGTAIACSPHSILHTRQLQHPEDGGWWWWWGSSPREHGSLPRVSRMLSCHDMTFLCSGLLRISSEEMDKLPSTVNCQERSPCAQGSTVSW